jgi:hypothetical protein
MEQAKPQFAYDELALDRLEQAAHAQSTFRTSITPGTCDLIASGVALKLSLTSLWESLDAGVSMIDPERSATSCAERSPRLHGVHASQRHRLDDRGAPRTRGRDSQSRW